jgi:CDP-glycerol glycerophosphotransferase (TagB/SpsB family)
LRKIQNILIFPYTRLSINYYESFIDKSCFNLVGYIDNNITGENVFNFHNAPKDFDKIHIVTINNIGMFTYIILKFLNFKLHKFQNISYDKSFYTISLSSVLLRHVITPKLTNYFVRWASKFFNKNKIALISEGFIDLNIKQLSLSLNKKDNFFIATDNNDHILKFNSIGIKTINIKSLTFLFFSLKSKIFIFDHTPINKICRLLIRQKCIKSIQIWHGIPLKRIGNFIDYNRDNFDLFIATSNFTLEIFKSVFSFNDSLILNYPRNDVFFSKISDNRELVLVNNDIYNLVLKTNLKILVYMPTWRENSFKSNPLNLTKFNEFLVKNDFLLIIKMHPFLSVDSYFVGIDSEFLIKGNFTNIIFYPSSDDIYPILPLTNLLITDYSSVAFDYLLTDNPQIFFIYDKDEYCQSRGKFMIDFDNNLAGDLTNNQSDLEDLIVKNLTHDTHKDKRLTLKKKFFDSSQKPATPILRNKIISYQ